MYRLRLRTQCRHDTTCARQVTDTLTNATHDKLSKALIGRLKKRKKRLCLATKVAEADQWLSSADILLEIGDC